MLMWMVAGHRHYKNRKQFLLKHLYPIKNKIIQRIQMKQENMISFKQQNSVNVLNVNNYNFNQM